MKHLAIAAFLALSALGASAQAMYFSSAQTPDNPLLEEETEPVWESVCDSLLTVTGHIDDDIFEMPIALPDAFFMPPVYDTYDFNTPLTVADEVHSGKPGLRWIEDYDVLNRQMAQLNDYLFYQHPELVKYNVMMLPEAPAKYIAEFNPSDFTISVREIPATPASDMTLKADEVEKRHWIRTFSASLQFSQAYVSPNWYQGGNNNLNALGNIYYNVKLNDKFHPNLMFETTAQYKLGMNNAPDDSIHAYNISEDIFQLNTTFGVKAVKRWYYSFTGQFKTQLLNSYKSNTRSLKSSFLSPGELTAGVGMTYSYTSPKKSFNFYASLAPVSYHLVTCLSSRINETNYGIEQGHKTVNSFGSTAELKMQWKLSYNIAYTGRIFMFTDYDSFQADWENTLAFEINRFLTTQIYAHLRYDTNTPRIPDSDWKKLQIKEIFSIGFAYKFSTL